MENRAKKDWMDLTIEWTCPYCGSHTIYDYEKSKTLGNKYEQADVKCGECEQHYMIYSDQDPEENGDLLGRIRDEDTYSEEDKRSAHEDQLYHEARDEGII